MAILHRGTSSGSSGNAFSLAVPAGTQAGDLLLLAVSTRNAYVGPPAGWTQIDSIGTAADGTGSATALQLHYKVATSDDLSATITIGDTGDYQVAALSAFAGVDGASPIAAFAKDVTPAASATVTWPSVTAPAAALIYQAVAHGIDSFAAQVSGYANAALADLTEIVDRGDTSFSGGGLAAVIGSLIAAGATGQTTAAIGAAYQARMTVALRAAVAAGGVSLGAAVGSIALTGRPADIRRGFALPAAAASLVLTGQAAGLRRSIAIVGTGTAIAIAGGAAQLLRDYVLGAAGIAYAATGQAATIQATRRLRADGVTLLLAGSSISMTRIGQRALPAAGGVFTLQGQSAGVRVQRRMDAGPASLVVTGRGVSLRLARRLVGGTGAYALLGRAAALQLARQIAIGQPARHRILLALPQSRTLMAAPQSRTLIATEIA